VFSAINILGLAGSMAVFILITVYVRLIAGTDKFHENHQRIFRLEREQVHNMAAPIGPYLKEQFPEVEAYVRSSKNQYSSNLFMHNNKTIRIENLWLVDSTFLDAFSFPLKVGDPKQVLSNPESIVLSESTAKRIFGSENPIGQSITSENRFNLQVTGVMEDFPANSSIQADAIVPFDLYKIMRNNPKALDNFYQWNYNTLLLMKPGVDIESFKEKINADLNVFIRKNIELPKDEKIEFILTPLTDIYFNTYKNDDDFMHGSRSNITIAIGVSLIILLLAIINFTNLSTAQATYRTKEIGIRKTIGASKSSLVKQHLLESILTAYISTFIAIILVEQLIHLFSSLVNVSLSFDMFDSVNIAIVIVGPLLLGLMAGSYPAFHISTFSPNAILSGAKTGGQKGENFRKILISTQFAASVILIAFTLHVNRQVNHLNNRDLGIERENKLFLETSSEMLSNREAFIHDIQANPIIKSASFHASPIGNFNEGWNMSHNGQDVSFNIQLADSTYFKTLGIKLLEGRSFKNHEPTDSVYEAVINKRSVDLYQWENPIGTTIPFMHNIKLRIVGVVNDFHFESLHKPIEPLMIVNRASRQLLTISYQAGQTQETIRLVEEIWNKYAPNTPLTYNILSDDLTKLYAEEARLKRLFQGFTLVAIFIACIGLFGLAAFSINKKIREIGIRKVLGSTSIGVVGLLSWHFLRLIIISTLVAIPISWWLISEWMHNFIVSAGHSFLLYTGSALLVMMVAMATIIYHAVKAANTNPASVLKYE
jgi:putative ABC transport system permease protein